MVNVANLNQRLSNNIISLCAVGAQVAETVEKPKNLPSFEEPSWNSYRKEMNEPQPIWGRGEETEKPSYEEWKKALFNF